MSETSAVVEKSLRSVFGENNNPLVYIGDIKTGVVNFHGQGLIKAFLFYFVAERGHLCGHHDS